MKKVLLFGILALALFSCTKEVEVEKIVYVDKIVEDLNRVNALQAQVNQLQSTNSNLQGQLNDLTSELDNVKSQLEDALNNEADEQTISNLENQLSNLENVVLGYEVGTIIVPESANSKYDIMGLVNRQKFSYDDIVSVEFKYTKYIPGYNPFTTNSSLSINWNDNLFPRFRINNHVQANLKQDISVRIKIVSNGEIYYSNWATTKINY